VPLLTVSVIVQVLLAGMVAPERVTLLAGAGIVPPQVLVAAGELLAVTPLANACVNPTAVRAYAFELLKVMVSVEFAFCPMLAGENASATVGAFGLVTVNVDDEVAVLPPAGPVMSTLAAMVLVNMPTALPDTLTVTVQLPFTGILASLKVTVFDVAVTVA